MEDFGQVIINTSIMQLLTKDGAVEVGNAYPQQMVFSSIFFIPPADII